jgi:hypothetical protein
VGGLGQFQVFVNGALDNRATASDLCCFSPNADSRRISWILRMDKAFPANLILLVLNRIKLPCFYIQRLRFSSGRATIVIPNSSRSPVPNPARFFDRHPLGILDRDSPRNNDFLYLGMIIFMPRNPH